MTHVQDQHVDAQAVRSDEPEVVAKMRAALIEHCQFAVAFAGPQILDAMLERVAAVPFEGYVVGYINEAIFVAKCALEDSLQPFIAAKQAEIAALASRNRASSPSRSTSSMEPRYWLRRPSR